MSNTEYHCTLPSGVSTDPVGPAFITDTEWVLPEYDCPALFEKLLLLMGVRAVLSWNHPSEENAMLPRGVIAASIRISWPIRPMRT